MNILDKIIAHKKIEVEQRKKEIPVSKLEKSMLFNRNTVSLKQQLQDQEQIGIIAEFKRKSPSKGFINQTAKVGKTTQQYFTAGASGISVLTDEHFFGGTNIDINIARQVNTGPILRKDFMIDEYQLIEAKSIGADVILLIAAALEPDRLKALAAFAKRLELEILMEVHTKEELNRSICPALDMIGVNNRNLTTFEVSIQNSLDLVDHIPTDFVKVAESGISKASSLLQLKEAGFEGFLIGGHFMEQSDPGQACKTFINSLKTSH